MGVAVLVAVVVLTLSGGGPSERPLALGVSRVGRIAVPVPRSWVIQVSSKPPDLLFAHPRSGAGQESVRVAVTPGTVGEEANAYLALARLQTPMLHVLRDAAAVIRGAPPCRVVETAYQLAQPKVADELASIDVFCQRRKGSVAHVNLVVPISEAGGDLFGRLTARLAL